MPKNYQENGKQNNSPINIIFSFRINFPIFLYVFQNTVFEKKIDAITVQILIQSIGKFLCVIWDLGTRTYQKFVTLRSFFKN